MGLNTQEIGLMEKLMDRESKHYQMELLMMGIGLMESLIEEDALILMEKYMKETGKRVSLLEEVLKSGQMVENMMEIGKWENQ